MRIRDLKPYLFGLFVYALMAACPSSCATTGKAALVFADVVDCSIESVASSALEIGGAVNRILVSGGGDWKDALGDLGRTVGMHSRVRWKPSAATCSRPGRRASRTRTPRRASNGRPTSWPATA